MRRLLATVAALVLLAAPVRASYTTATYTSQTVDSGGLHLQFQLTGNAGESPVTYVVTISDPGATGLPEYVNNALYNQIQALNRQQTIIGNLPVLNSSIVPTAPTPPAASTFGSFRMAATVSPGTTPQDVCTIGGSATKIVTVESMELASTQTTAGVNGWQIVKRSTANTGGTSTTPTSVPTDTTFPAATANLRTYTANPTAGTLVGAIWSGVIASPAAATATTSLLGQKVAFDRGSITLATGESLSWNFNGVALPAGLSVRCTMGWSER